MSFDLRNTISFVLCLVLCLASSGCDVLYRLLDKEGAEEKALVGEILPFEKNVAVEEVQALLKIYGYNVGKVDGVLGLRTRNAIEKFQRDNALEPTRFVDQATWERLNLFKENKLVVDRNLNIRFIQSLLRDAGFDPGKIDGKAGPKTKKAIKEFQQAYGLKADGKIGYKTLDQLAAFAPAVSPDE